MKVSCVNYFKKKDATPDYSHQQIVHFSLFIISSSPSLPEPELILTFLW